MILLFKNNSSNYWLSNSIVDCGQIETTDNNLSIEFSDIAQTDNDLSIEFSDIAQTDNDLFTEHDKKLNNKHKHNNDNKINDTKYEKVFIRRNDKFINGNTTKKNSEYKYMGYKYKQKDLYIKFTDIPPPIKYKHLHKHFIANCNK